MLAVDNFSYSSKVASAFRSIFAITLQGRTSAPTISISVVRTMPPALVSCKGSLLITTHAVDVPFTRTPPFVHRTSRAPTLRVVSPSSRSSAQGSRISAFAPWRIKEVLDAVRCKPVRGCRPSFRLGLANVHHELDTLAGESNLYCLSVRSSWTSSNWQGIYTPLSRNPLCAPILIPVRLSLH